MRHVLALLALVLSLMSVSLLANEAEPVIDPEIRDRFKMLTEKFRCQKCQNQTIWDSGAGLAADLKRQIKEQIYQGKTDAEIEEYMVARYGDFILYKPKMDSKNMLLWTGPFLLFFVGAVMLFLQIRKRKATVETQADISADDEARIKALMQENKGGDKQ